MEHPRQQKARPGAPTGTYNLVPAGLAQTKRRFLAARFPEKEPRAPRFVATPGDGSRPPLPAEDYILAVVQQPARQQQKGEQQQQQQQKDASLLLTRKSQKGSGSKQLQGQPRTDDKGNYFMLSKGGGARDFVLQPLDATFTFKQLSRAHALSIDEVEAQMRAAGGGGADPARLLPKSMRQQMQESAAAVAAEKQLQEEVVPLFDKQKVAELSVKYGGPSTQGSKLVVGHSDDEEGSDEGWGLTGADDDMPSAAGNARKRGPGKDKGKPGTKGGAAKGRKGGKDDADSIPEDELPEDIFAGEEDELRPAAPVEDADWEYNEDAADDDLDQGASDEEGLADDPGYRKQLGLEADEEEEEKKEEGGEEGEGEGGEGAKPGAAAAGGAGAGAAGSQAASIGGSVESESVMDDDELGAEVIDAEDLDRLAEEREHSVGQPAKRRKGSVGPPGRERSPAPSRLATPPLGSTAAAAAAAAGGAGSSRATSPLGGRRGSTPPLGRAAAAAAGGSRQGSAAAGSSRKTPPPGATGAARRTPPPAGAAAAAAAAAGAAKRKREEAAGAGAVANAAFAAGAAAAAAGSGAGAAVGGVRGYIWRPEQLDAQGVPTVESVGQALAEMGPITTSQLSLLQEHLDVGRIGDEGKKLLKQRMLQVAKVESRNGVKYVVLKHAA